MHITFTLNGSGYQVSEYAGGWAWISLTHDEESEGCFPSPMEAQQDAINWEAGRDQREEDAEEAEREANELRQEERKEHDYLNWTRR